MPFFTITNKAKADLKEIGRYTQEHWGRDQRNQYLTMMDACFHQLAANPHIERTVARFGTATVNSMRAAMLFFTVKQLLIRLRLFAFFTDEWT